MRDAQVKAGTLFHEVQARDIIRPGVTEKDVNEAIFALAKELFETDTHWHKRIVRAGANTLAVYDENPPNLTLGDDDIVFLDFGPVFEEWEADFGRTYVLGNDPLKNKLCDDVAAAFADGKRYFNDRPEITSSDLFTYARSLAEKYGWEFGGQIAGHLIGHFPHERIPNDRVSLYVHPQNDLRMRTLDANGQARHWILEIHFVDRARRIGGFYEELITI
ncbi:MAG TPA: M24 family metallopeptidase [Candidatus Acidoferrales bacterium]|nr:M24 family metallopeptidase [Candidatus Acidoferrales bacterium]